MAYQHKREPLTADEVQRLVGATRTSRERLVVLALLDLGLRVSELVGLRAEDVDWQAGAIVVRGKGGPYGSRSKRRVVALPDRLRPLLEAALARDGDMRRELGSARTVQRRLRELANRAGISRPVTPHVLRHTFAVRSLRRGIELPALQRALGHDRLTSTEAYCNLSADDVLRAYREKW